MEEEDVVALSVQLTVVYEDGPAGGRPNGGATYYADAVLEVPASLADLAAGTDGAEASELLGPRVRELVTLRDRETHEHPVLGPMITHDVMFGDEVLLSFKRLADFELVPGSQQMIERAREGGLSSADDRLWLCVARVDRHER